MNMNENLFGDKMETKEKVNNADIEEDGKFIQILENLDVVFYTGPKPSPELLNDIRKANPSVSRIWENAIFYKEPESYELLKQQRDTTKRDTTKFVMAMSTEMSSPENIITTIVNAVKNNSDISYLVAISYNSQVEKEIIIRGIRERLGLKENEVPENSEEEIGPLEEPEFKTKNEGIEAPISGLLHTITEMLGIPLITDAKELHGNSNFILFASRHDNRNEVKDLKYIIVDALERSNKKIIVAAEDFSDEIVYKLLNNPKTDVDSKVMQDYIATFSYPDIAKEEIKAFREIQQKYGTDRFEIVPIGATIKDTEDMLKNKISKEKFDKERDAIIAEAVLKLYETYKDTITLLVYTGAIHSIDILKNIMKMESVKKEEIKKDVSVFVPPENIIQDLRYNRRD